MDIYEALQTAEQQLERLRTDVRAAETECEGLRLAIERYERRAQPERPHYRLPVPPDDVDAIWGRMNRTDAVHRLLREEGPLSPTAIAEALRARGRDDTSALISATLSLLHSRGHRVERVGHALWAAATDSATIKQPPPPPPNTNLVPFRV